MFCVYSFCRFSRKSVSIVQSVWAMRVFYLILFFLFDIFGDFIITYFHSWFFFFAYLDLSHHGRYIVFHLFLFQFILDSHVSETVYYTCNNIFGLLAYRWRLECFTYFHRVGVHTYLSFHFIRKWKWSVVQSKWANRSKGISNVKRKQRRRIVWKLFCNL